MPAQVPKAQFLPISPRYNFDRLVEETPNFEFVTRISHQTIKDQDANAFEKLILLHVILGGKPLVIEGYQDELPKHLFSVGWLDQNEGRRVEKVRDLGKRCDTPMTIGHYLRNMEGLNSRITRHNYGDERLQRLYLKDIDCPSQWHNYLKEHLIPPGLDYLNTTTGDIGGPGAIDQESRTLTGKRRGRGVAPAGDLMSSLPPAMRAENMMCYIGHGGTYTPAHREMCATIGHNIMVEASQEGSLDVSGKAEQPGSSIWFMTETKDRYLVSEYWMSVLHHDIEVENHFAQIAAWTRAPFKTYLVDQKVGDFIIIPPLAPHQVWNRGTRTMKVAWNRTTVETLEMAMKEALPRARMVCRDEQYKNKAIIYFTLVKYAGLLDRINPNRRHEWSAAALDEIRNSRKIRQLQKDFKRLFLLFTDILLSETFSEKLPKEKDIDFIPFDSNVTCAYCRGNIFNRFLTCPNCIGSLPDGEEDTYDVCMECYAMGRSCGNISGLKWVEQFPWENLSKQHALWRDLIIALEGGENALTPMPLLDAKKQLGKKTLAQICQEQLEARPVWSDHTQPYPRPPRKGGLDEETELEDLDERERKKRWRTKMRSSDWKSKYASCHISKDQFHKWRLASCQCGLQYSFGSLFRGFDLMPQQVLEVLDWKCPRCEKRCSCRSCIKDKSCVPYEPSGTIVGHDTKTVADPRSVEVLVDFSKDNLHWVSKHEVEEQTPHESTRLRRFREQAEEEKARDESLNEAMVDDDGISRHGQTSTLRPVQSTQNDTLNEASGEADGVLRDEQTNTQGPMRSTQPKQPETSQEQSIQIDPDMPLDPDLFKVPQSLSAMEMNTSEARARKDQQFYSGVYHALTGAPELSRGNGAPTPADSRAPPITTPSQQNYPNATAIAAAGLAAMHVNGQPQASPGQSAPPPHNISPHQSSPHPDNVVKYANYDGSSDSCIASSNVVSQARPDMGPADLQTPHRHAPPARMLASSPQDNQVMQQRKHSGSGMYSANRQFAQAQLQHTMAEARKRDRLHMTTAALRGLKKVVRFKLPRDALVSLQTGQKTGDAMSNVRSRSNSEGSAEPMREIEPLEGPVVTSDIKDAESIAFAPVISDGAESDQDKDAAYSPRKSHGPDGARKAVAVSPKAKSPKVGRPRATRKADSEDESDIGVARPPKKRRESAWLARKNAGEAANEFPTVLPERTRRKRHSMPQPKAVELPTTKPKVSEESMFVEVDENYRPIVRTTGWTSAATDVTTKERSGKGKSSFTAEEVSTTSRESKSTKVQAASVTKTGSRHNPYQEAKMMALRVAEGDGSSSEDEARQQRMSRSSKVTPKQEKRSAPAPPSSHPSLSSRPGMQGKKFKIVSKQRVAQRQREALLRTTKV
ncbi:MAG: hypothetical protein M1817_006096 [Caeruleum heppii]|nr:MAG: hypothetical protein M1817_006096 [Caeruleum heppii]